MTTITPLTLDGVLLIEPVRHIDERGLFCEVFREGVLAAAGFEQPFVQENVSRSNRRGTVRGLHYQSPPHAQDKLVRVIYGAVLDVVVDIRLGSSTYGRSLMIELSAENWRQVLVPKGFAHGFCTLTDNTEVAYKVTSPYHPAAEGGLLWSDQALAIDWPISPGKATLNARDAAWPSLSALQSPFG